MRVPPFLTFFKKISFLSSSGQYWITQDWTRSGELFYPYENHTLRCKSVQQICAGLDTAILFFIIQLFNAQRPAPSKNRRGMQKFQHFVDQSWQNWFSTEISSIVLLLVPLTFKSYHYCGNVCVMLIFILLVGNKSVFCWALLTPQIKFPGHFCSSGHKKHVDNKGSKSGYEAGPCYSRRLALLAKSALQR